MNVGVLIEIGARLAPQLHNTKLMELYADEPLGPLRDYLLFTANQTLEHVPGMSKINSANVSPDSLYYAPRDINFLYLPTSLVEKLGSNKQDAKQFKLLPPDFDKWKDLPPGTTIVFLESTSDATKEINLRTVTLNANPETPEILKQQIDMIAEFAERRYAIAAPDREAIQRILQRDDDLLRADHPEEGRRLQRYAALQLLEYRKQLP